MIAKSATIIAALAIVVSELSFVELLLEKSSIPIFYPPDQVRIM
jgi:hypothetical protein